MSIVAKGGAGTNYEAPPTGVHPAICIDIIDLGNVKTPFKDEKTGADKWQHQVQAVWQLYVEDNDGKEVTREDGKPFRVSKFYNLSLNEKANLRKDLESWRGKRFKDEEVVDGFDVEKVIGLQCQLGLVSKDTANGERIIVDAVMPKHRRDPSIEAEKDFVREKDRPGGRDTRSPKAEGEGGTAESEAVDDLPDLPDLGDNDDLPF
jgi:hypothetical protein